MRQVSPPTMETGGSTATGWPNFFVVGAARSGPTSLYYHLNEHPDVYMSPIKEPYYFGANDAKPKPLRRLGSGVIKKKGDYLKLFQGAQNQLDIGEATPAYLFDPHTPSQIKDQIPQAKIIMVLREPIDRAYSHYLLTLQRGRERKPFYSALQRDYALPRKIYFHAHLYIEMGLYYRQVKRYLDTFGSQQVRIYLYEDLTSNTACVMEDVCNFLGVPFYDGEFFDPAERYNTYLPPRNPLLLWLIVRNPLFRALKFSSASRQLGRFLRRRFLLTEGQKPPLDPKAGAFLGSLYHDDVLKLQSLIGRDLSAWLVECSKYQGIASEWHNEQKCSLARAGTR